VVMWYLTYRGLRGKGLVRLTEMVVCRHDDPWVQLLVSAGSVLFRKVTNTSNRLFIVTRLTLFGNFVKSVRNFLTNSADRRTDQQTEAKT